MSGLKRKSVYGQDERGMLVLKLFHGTSWERAKQILRDGFIESTVGCLGPGIYVAREEKARKFAANKARHGGREGGLVTVLVSYRRAKYVGQNDTTWQAQGFDACRAEETSSSNNMEWCFKNRDQLEVIAMERVDIDEYAEPVELLPPPPPADLTFRVTCLFRVAELRSRPEYPGNDVRTGTDVQPCETVVCRPAHGNTRFVTVTHIQACESSSCAGAYCCTDCTKVHIHFFRLRDGSGWIHDYIHDYSRKKFPERNLHVHSSEQLSLTLKPNMLSANRTCRELRSAPEYPGDGKRNGVFFRLGDVAIADSTVRTIEFCDFDIRLYRLVDGPGWLHDFPSEKPSQRFIQAVPFVKSEEATARQRVAKLDTDAAVIARERESAAGVLARFEKQRQSAERRAEEARQQRERKEQEEKDRLERAAAQKEQEEKEQREREIREHAANILRCDRASRGTNRAFFLCHSDHVSRNFDDTVTCISTNDDSTVMLYESGSWAYTPGLPTPVYNKLNGRSLSHPPPTYVSIGTKGRYYIKFANGKSEWVGSDAMGETLHAESRSVQSVAFGSDFESHFIVFSDGWWSYNNVPLALVAKIGARDRRSDLACVSLGPDGEWYMKANNGKSWWGGVSDRCSNEIKSIKDRIKFMDFGDDDSYLIRYE